MRLKALGLAIALSASSVTASPLLAQDSSYPFLLTNWFVRNCDTKTWQLACTGYILGYFQGSESREKNICLPDGVDTGQLIAVGLKYMREHP